MYIFLFIKDRAIPKYNYITFYYVNSSTNDKD